MCCVTAPFSLYFQSLFCPNTRVTATLSPHSPHRALRLSWLSHTPPRSKKSIMEQNPGDEGFRRLKEEHRYVVTKEKPSGALPMACHSKGEPVQYSHVVGTDAAVVVIGEPICATHRAQDPGAPDQVLPTLHLPGWEFTAVKLQKSSSIKPEEDLILQ